MVGLGREAILVLHGNRWLVQLGVFRPRLIVRLVSGGWRQRPGAGPVTSELGAQVVL